MTRWLMWIAILLAPLALSGQVPTEDQDLEISLVTFGPGPLAWEHFGHNALWVRQPSRGLNVLFNYGRSYLDRTIESKPAIAIYEPELPLRAGVLPLPAGLAMPGCIRDAAPDAWGRRVIINKKLGLKGAGTDTAELDELTYLLESGSDRIGALDFQRSPTEYVPRTATNVSMEELIESAERVERGVPLTPELDQALFHGSSIGGARPKAGQGPCGMGADHARGMPGGAIPRPHHPAVWASGARCHFLRLPVCFGITQHIATAPDRLDIVLAFRCPGQFLAQLADEDIDDFQFRLVHAAVQVVQEHFLGERGALAQRQQFQHLVFLAGQMNRRAIRLNRFGIQIHCHAAGMDNRLRMPLGAADDCVNTGDQFFPVERFGQIVIRAEPKTLDLVFGVIGTRQDQDRR